MSRIKELVRELDETVNETWSDHLNYHDAFDEFRGRELTEDDAIRANESFLGIQATYSDLVPFFRLIGQRAEFVGNAIQSYNTFIEHLEKQGVLSDKTVSSDTIH